MIIGSGIDILEISRVDKAAKSERFMHRVFTDRELEYLKSKGFKGEALCGTFCAKEAVSKSLGTGFRGFSLKDIEVLRDALGKPYVNLYDGALKRAENLNYTALHITISHDRERATAFAILEGGGPIKPMETVRKYCESSSYKTKHGQMNCEKDNLKDVEYEKFISSHIPVRDDNGHKGTYGRSTIIAGSKGFAGAAYLCTRGALRSGSGLVTLCCKGDIMDIMAVKLDEAMVASIEEHKRISDLIKSSNSIAIGPGLGVNDESFELIRKAIDEGKCPLVIDADAISCLKDRTSILKKGGKRIVITPHVGEMSRITGLTIDYINENRREVSESFAREHDIIVLLKGKDTIITDGINTLINPTGNSAMASGGMGDALTGIIAGFIAQGISPIYAAACGAYIHGKAADILAEECYSVLAGDVLEMVPYILKSLSKG